MDVKAKINSLLKEAKVYQSQGLFDQSKERYSNVLDLIKDNPKLSKDQKLISSVKAKMKEIDGTLDEIEEASDTPELSEKVQDLISNLFSFSKNKDVSAIEGAVALAKFGQYEKATAEFQRLINEGVLPLMAAKNMIRCHMSLGSSDAVLKQFQRWISRSSFPPGELNYLRNFIQNLFESEGIKAAIPELGGKFKGKEKVETRSEDVFEISTVRVTFEEGPQKDKTLDFNVAFQLGNSISFNVSKGEKDLAEFLKPGAQLNKIRFFSPVSIFHAAGIVSDKKEVTAGPKKGDFIVDLIIEDSSS